MDQHEHEHDEHGHDEHGHSHDVSNLSGRKIFWVTVLNATITITEVIGGLVSGSLSLLSDAMHNFSDTLSIVISYVANRIGAKPKDEKKTFGYKRAEILAAFINSLVLTVISIFLIYEAIERFFKPQGIETGVMLIVAVIGLLANLFSVFLLQKDSKKSMNIKSSYLHMLSDTLSSVGVIIGGLLIRFFNITWVDPLITVLIALYILKEAIEILKESINILMQSSPDLDFNAIIKEVEALEYVNNIHHVHAWRMDEENIFFEAHIDIEDQTLSSAQGILHNVEELLKDHYHIQHVTLQIETDLCCEPVVFHK